MKKEKKLFFFLLFCTSLLFSNNFSSAQTQEDKLQNINFKEQFFEAKVLEIIEEQEILQPDGSKHILQSLKIIGTEGEWQNKEIIIKEVETDTGLKKLYQKNDKVLISYQNIDGTEFFYIVDFVRREKLYLLALIFVLIILITSRWRGLRAILGLVFSFLIIFQFVIPKILAGGNPLSVSLFYCSVIILVSTYLVYGLNKKSSIAILGMFAGIFIVSVVSFVFSQLTRLAGFAQEETLYLANFIGEVNLKGLMLAGFIIGALGVLDDIAISQVSAVQELKKANPSLSKFEIYKRAMEIGIDHIASMVNTLFLAYAGASFPLLILFCIKLPPFETFNQVINNEIIATEIVRTLVGSIGLVLTVPITTLLAAHFYKRLNKKTNRIIKNSNIEK